MNGKPEKWCGRCVGTGTLPGRNGPVQCPCVRRDTPILAPVKCKGCGGRYSPHMDGSMPHHGSLGWSCDGKKKVTR